MEPSGPTTDRVPMMEEQQAETSPQPAQRTRALRMEPAVLKGLLEKMLLIRRFEEKAAELYSMGKIGGFCHLYIGQEAVGVGAISTLGPDDYIFASYREHVPRLFQVDLGTHQVARLVPGPGVVLDGAWSPDGTRLLVTREEGGNSDIYLLDRSGQVLQRLTDHWAIDVSPAWAPDGRRFAFCSARAGSPQIYVMSVDGSNLVRVSHTGSYNTSPSWSPKGDHIAYTTRSGGGFQIVVTTPDGGNAQTITSAGSNEDPSWAPDGRYLAFSSTRAGGHHLFLADREGRTQKQLTHGAGDDTSPAWSPRLE